MLPDSTNPRVMADNIRRLQTEVENAVELPSVGTSDEGKVLTVNSSGKWAAANLPASIPKDYSTTETDTGLKWIDGKNIYAVTFTGTTGAEAGSETLGRLSAFDSLVHIYGSISGGQQTYVHAIERALDVSVDTRNGNVIATTNASYVSAPYGVTILFTKPTETREPDEETKKTTKRKTTKGEN